MAMAYWKGMTWGVSDKEIAYLESLTTIFAIETETNADKEGNSASEDIAPSLVEFAMNTTYRVETGTKDIRGKINAWKALVGKSAPLIIGGATFGPDKVQLQSVGVTNLEIDAKGVMRAVNLAFKFKEVPYTASGTTTTTTTATTASTAKETETETTLLGKDIYGITSLKGQAYSIFTQPTEQEKAELKTASMHISSSGVTHGGGGRSFVTSETGSSSGSGRRR